MSIRVDGVYARTFSGVFEVPLGRKGIDGVTE